MPTLNDLLAYATEADLRRFAAACCRTIPVGRLEGTFEDAIGDPHAWDRLLAISERYADGAATDDELAQAVDLARRVDEAEAWQSEPASAAATAVHVAVAMRNAYAWKPQLDGLMRDAVLQVVDEVAEAGGHKRPALIALWQRRFANPPA